MVLLVAACDPTGNTNISSGAAFVRFGAFVSDATVGGVTITSGAGTTLTSGLTYGNLSAYKSVDPDSTLLTTKRSSDSFVLGSDTLIGDVGVHYTNYLIGTVTAFRSLIAPDDTVLSDSGQIKLRFVHAIRTDSLVGFDLYITTPDADISGMTPQIASLSYGAASAYVIADTSARQLRVTHTGVKGVEFDTTFVGVIADSQVVTIVAADQPSGGRRLQRVVDKAP